MFASVSVLLLGVAQGATWRVPEDVETVSAAVQAAVSGDRIEVGAGSWSSNVRIEADLDIVGAGPEATHLLGRVEVREATVRFAHLRLSRLDTDDAALLLADLLVADETGAEAPLVLVDSDVRIARSVFRDNTTAGDGGAVEGDESRLVLVDVVFERNEAARGGAVYLDGGSLELLGGRFEANTAGTEGGAAWLADLTTVRLEAGLFLANTAGDGGGLFVTRVGALEADGNLLCANQATGDGGALHLVGVTQTWRRSLFVDNVAGTHGGGLFASGGTVDLRGNDFLGNRAANGGGLRLEEPTTWSFVDNLVAFTAAGHGLVVLRDPVGGEGVRHGLWHANTGQDLGGPLSPSTVGPGNLFEAPLLVAYSADGDCSNDAYAPASGSPLVDAGEPREDDPLPDIGAVDGPSPLDGDGDGALTEWDCDDGDPLAYPGAREVCDEAERDEDCDGLVDDADPDTVRWPWHHDGDNDGWGTGPPFAHTCDPQPNASAFPGDCDDAEPEVHPLADEVCNGRDDDCDELLDAEDPGLVDGHTGFSDGDGDGWGVQWTVTCDGERPLADLPGDCDDGAPTVNPGATDVPNDAVDQDCGGAPDEARFGNGLGWGACGCAIAPPAAPWTLVVLVLWLRRRRG